MNYLKVCFIVCLCTLCMTACNPSPSPDSTSENKPATNSELPTQSTEKEEPLVPSPSLEVVDTVFYTSDYADGCIYMAARVKNTGNVIIGMDQWNCSFDMLDADGALVFHADYPEIAPIVVQPDEYGYLSALILDDAVDLTACVQVQCNVSWDNLLAVPFRIPMENISPKKYSGSFYAFQGMLVNDKEYDVADITPVIVLLDSKTDALLGVNIGRVVDSIPAGSRIGTKGDSSAPIPLSAFNFDEVNPKIEAFGTYSLPLGE